MNSFAGLSVLLIEDEYLIALDAEQILKELGFHNVEIAGTWERATKLAENGRFDVALLDVNINGKLSFPIAKIFNQRGIPVVFASGYDLRERVSEVDAVCIAKPYTGERVKEALAKALAKRPDGK
jgi:DNA-binding NtrC family response regulator